MKKKNIELDVDFIGGQGYSLTKEDELAISEFIRKDKEKRKLKELRKKAAAKRKEKHLA
ncbi:hypothetical protein SAMN05444410_110113 [Hydrobacter penzbergensis]|uniref:Uncharacterized protein n=1 Tax=Hydrobacter penzbergensis TaxID=1235997 RepID=A0A8X8IGM4_9BACT|nr:hypothetical protein [Hydrobacter penzbergensis]SDX19525.1 hypothetical protein SAMN05444410_110113 [Hydrobacter penzbergensis]